MKCCRVLVYVVGRVNVLKAVSIYFVDPVVFALCVLEVVRRMLNEVLSCACLRCQ